LCSVRFFGIFIFFIPVFEKLERCNNHFKNASIFLFKIEVTLTCFNVECLHSLAFFTDQTFFLFARANRTIITIGGSWHYLRFSFHLEIRHDYQVSYASLFSEISNIFLENSCAIDLLHGRNSPLKSLCFWLSIGNPKCLPLQEKVLM
jgi:hypothetical protein